ncbi:MAG: hypothetical protein RBT75_15590, partial [Anaerolineae bacterium]|nr:hypothetical protein [Anaerolineae bacterium]
MKDAIELPHRNTGDHKGRPYMAWGCLGLLTLSIIGLLIAASYLLTRPGDVPAGPLPTGDLLLATNTPTPTPTPTSTPPPRPPTS